MFRFVVLPCFDLCRSNSFHVCACGYALCVIKYVHAHGVMHFHFKLSGMVQYCQSC